MSKQVEGITKEIFETKKIDKEWSFSEFTRKETAKWTNCYHRYPAKFVPQLVEKLMDEYINSKNAHINDPFMGSGTTIVSAIARGYKASGTDINKIAYLMTKVKAMPIEPDYLKNKTQEFLYQIEKIDEDDGIFSPTNNLEPLIPEKHIERINYWFNEKNKIKLGKILRIINNEKDEKIRDFFEVAFSHILKNCSIWLQGSTKPTRDFKKNPMTPNKAIARRLKKMERGNKSFFEVVPNSVKNRINNYLNIKCDDAKRQPVKDNSVDLIITSSPYVTSYEYADLHQLSTIWLDFADNLTDYKKEFIGTSYKKYKDKKIKSQIAIDIVDKMFEKSPKIAQEIEAFFIDMKEVFDESYRILKPGGRCCYVIGDTRLKGVDILNAEVFAESLQYSGFKLDRIIKREIPSKILPQKRDKKTGRFANNNDANSEAYPIEYIIIGRKI